MNVELPRPTLIELAEGAFGRNYMIEIRAGTPIGHAGAPSEIAGVAAFLRVRDSYELAVATSARL